MWRELTEDDILGVLNASEQRIYLAAVKGTEQDVFVDISTAVINHARGYIADNPANSLADGLTLPERVIRPALHLIRKDLLTRLNQEVSEDRRKDASEALRFFERVADGRVQIEQPTGDTDDSGSSSSTETLASRDRISTRAKLSGL